jgi:hypothetical protein
LIELHLQVGSLSFPCVCTELSTARSGKTKWEEKRAFLTSKCPYRVVAGARGRRLGWFEIQVRVATTQRRCKRLDGGVDDYCVWLIAHNPL